MKVLLSNVSPQDVGLLHEFIMVLAKSDGVAEIMTIAYFARKPCQCCIYLAQRPSGDHLA